MGFVYNTGGSTNGSDFQSTLQKLKRKKKYKCSPQVGEGHIRQSAGKKLTRKSRLILQSLGYKVCS